jgi:hypothetical protein
VHSWHCLHICCACIIFEGRNHYNLRAGDKYNVREGNKYYYTTSDFYDS